MALLGGEGDVLVSDLEANELARFRAESEASWALAWSPDGGLLAASYEEGVHLWRIDAAGCAG